MTTNLQDPQLVAAVKRADSALTDLFQLIDDETELQCGLEDVLDCWDDFTNQFDLTESEHA